MGASLPTTQGWGRQKGDAILSQRQTGLVESVFIQGQINQLTSKHVFICLCHFTGISVKMMIYEDLIGKCFKIIKQKQ